MTEDKKKGFSFGSEEYPLKVSFTEFKGKKYLDIRKWYLDKKSDEIKPTKKGISLSHVQFQNIIELLFDEKKSIVDWLSKPTSNEEFFNNLEKKSQLIRKQSEEAKKFKTKNESWKDSSFFKIEYKDNEKYLVFNKNHELLKALEKEIAEKNDWVLEIDKANIWEGDNSIKCPNCKDMMKPLFFKVSESYFEEKYRNLQRNKSPP